MGCEAPNETLIPSDELRFYVEVRKGRTLHTILVEKYDNNRPFWRSRREGQYTGCFKKNEPNANNYI